MTELLRTLCVAPGAYVEAISVIRAGVLAPEFKLERLIC
jgi:hypothetical protein